MREIQVALITWVRLQQLQEQCYPFLPMCAVFLCVQTVLWLPVFGNFNVRTEIVVCNYTWGLHSKHSVDGSLKSLLCVAFCQSHT